MSNHTTTTRSARTLNYSLDSSLLNRIKEANLMTAKVGSMKAPGEGFGKNISPDILNATKLVATGTIDFKKALEEGKEATRLLKEKFKNAELTEGWNTVELKDQVTKAETERQTRYNEAVREGDKALQEKILEEQQVAVAAFAKHDALGKTVLDTQKNIGFIDNENAFSTADKYFLGEYADPRNLMIIDTNVDGEKDGITRMGVKYQTTNPDEPGYIDPAEAEKLLKDPNSGYRKMPKMGPFDEGESEFTIVRALTTSDVTDMLGNATLPTVEANEIEKQIQRLEKEKAKYGDPAEEGGGESTYNFNNETVSTSFGSMINESNSKKMMYGDLSMGTTFAQDFLLHPDFETIDISEDFKGFDNISLTVPEGTLGDTGGGENGAADGILTVEEMAAADDDVKKLILKELEKPENIEILKAYWGEWAMLKAKRRVDPVKFGGVANVPPASPTVAPNNISGNNRN